MANKLLLKKSSVVAKIPTTADLDYGELALNYADGKLYYKTSGNTIDAFASASASAAVTSVVGLTGDVSTTQILTAIETIDGAGSGLDADLLDGYNSSTTDVASTVVVRDTNKFIGVSGINLSTNDINAPATVQMRWNVTDSTWEYQLKNNVTLQAGQELHFYGRATEAISNGDVVMFAGTQGDGILIARANTNAIGFHPSWVVGIATQNIAINEWGYVTWFGKVNGVDTFGLTLGDILYLDPTVTGGLTPIQPVAPNPKIRIASVVRVANAINSNNGILMVRPHYAEKLSELQDVSITSIANGDLIAWDSTNSRWQNATQSAITSGDSDKLDGQHGTYYLDWTNTTNKPDPVVTVTLTGDVTGTGNATLTDLASGTISFATTIAANSVALGTDTTGNYVASIANGSYITGGAAGSEGATLTLAVDATSANTVSKVVARDASGGFSAGTVTLNALVIDGALRDYSTLTTTATTQVALVSFAAATYGSGEVIIQATQGAIRQISKLLVVHNGTIADATEYGSIQTGVRLFTTEVDISAGNVRVLVTPTSATSTVYKASYTLIGA